jgi:MFS family permease
MKIITRSIWLLSLVSLFTDVASEMLYPVIPLYLQSIAIPIVLIGVLEGFAEAIAGLSKGYFGKLSDSMGSRLPFVRLGYGLSALAKPLMALWPNAAWIFGVRSLDRLGKGIRTGARDALLSDEATPETKGQVFGFHRSMDTLGAVLGPAIALAYLYYYPGNYKSLFFIALAPGVLSILCTFLLREKQTKTTTGKKAIPFGVAVTYWRSSSPVFKKLIGALLLFALINSSDMFLLLQIKATGITDTQAIGMYIFYNLVYALAAYPLGVLADKIGLKKIMLFGLCCFAVAYAGMAVSGSMYLYFELFFVYGLYAAATEGISKAWISNITPKTETATAIGCYSGLQSICTLFASTAAGLIWHAWGAQAVFIVSAAITVLIIFYLAWQVPYKATAH